MKITLNEITFTREEMISYLQENGYKLEEHKTIGIQIGGMEPIKTTKMFAIPNGEEFNEKTHKNVENTFES